MKERWTLYETYTKEENPERAGEYKLYRVNDDGSLGDLYDGSLEDANKEEVPVGAIIVLNDKIIARANALGKNALDFSKEQIEENKRWGVAFFELRAQKLVDFASS